MSLCPDPFYVDDEDTQEVLDLLEPFPLSVIHHLQESTKAIYQGWFITCWGFPFRVYAEQAMKLEPLPMVRITQGWLVPDESRGIDSDSFIRVEDSHLRACPEWADAMGECLAPDGQEYCGGSDLCCNCSTDGEWHGTCGKTQDFLDQYPGRSERLRRDSERITVETVGHIENFGPALAAISGLSNFDGFQDGMSVQTTMTDGVAEEQAQRQAVLDKIIKHPNTRLDLGPDKGSRYELLGMDECGAFTDADMEAILLALEGESK